MFLSRIISTPKLPETHAMRIFASQQRAFSRRRIIGFLLISLSGWLSFFVTRALILMRNGDEIGRRSATFSRDYFVGNAANLVLEYLVLGDSTAAGWGANTLRGTFPFGVAQALAARGFRVHVVNIAVGGARLDDLMRVQLPALQHTKPQIITVSIGANDATHNTDEIEYSKQMQTLLSALQNSGARQIIIGNSPNFSRDPALPFFWSKAATRASHRKNAHLEILVKNANSRGNQIRIVDLFRDGELVHRRDDDQYAADLFHPSSSGYKIWADLFVAQLNECSKMAP